MHHFLQRAKLRLERTLGVYYPGSATYWERRYVFGGDSGSGSSGRLAGFKAKFLNSFVGEHGVSSVVELGCGDGRQLQLAEYPRYVGIDVSHEAVKRCRRVFDSDMTKTFVHASDISALHQQYDLALSLDVIFHLTEDHTYERYMRQLFSLSNKWVIIYSSNISHEEFRGMHPFYDVMHVKHRRFLDWIEGHADGWFLTERMPNPFPFDPDDPASTSFADFYVFEKSA